MRRVTSDDLPLTVRSVDGPLFGDAYSPFDDSPTRPSETEELIAGLIWPHKGRHNPISISRIEQATNLSPRQIKGVVQDLRVIHRLRIGARREEPAGYFRIMDAEDQAAAVAPYRAQILTMWRTLQVLDSKRELRELLGQLRLECE